MPRISFLLLAVIILNVILFFVFLFTRHYPQVLMSLHILSLLVLWIMVIRDGELVKVIKSKQKELFIVAALIALSLFVGMYRLEEVTPGMYADEVTVFLNGEFLLQNPNEWPPFIGRGYYHPTPLLYITAESVNAFGHTMTAIRIPSVIFGALAVGLFYIFLRLFFPVPLAIGGALLLVFQYTHIILSRLAYEPPPSLFFQLVTLIFLVLYWRKRTLPFLIGIALGIGAGLYTYLNFRAFALIVILLTIMLLLKGKWQKHIKEAGLFFVLIFVCCMPLVSFALTDWHNFWGRASEISIFGRQYTQAEFMKELLANIASTVGFPFIGDPNPGKNPSGVTLFDPITMIFALLGCVFLWRKQRKLFWITLLFFIPPFVSDIFSTEVIPEFHYYGLGHPNALRVSGLIILVLFAAVYGIYWIYSKVSMNKFHETLTVMYVIVAGICLLNWHMYFNQKEFHPAFYAYNYKYNHAKTIKAMQYINGTKASNISVTQDISENARFFLDQSKRLTSFDFTSTASARKAIQNSDLTAIAITNERIPILKSMANELANAKYTVQLLNDPFGYPELAIVEKPIVFTQPSQTQTRDEFLKGFEK